MNTILVLLLLGGFGLLTCFIDHNNDDNDDDLIGYLDFD